MLKMVEGIFRSGAPTTAKFDPILPAEYLLESGNRKLHKLPGIEDALSRFEKLFTDLNRSL